MRLIDADELREKMYHEAFEKDSDMQKWDSGCWIRYKMFENAIDDVPTVEQPQWIPVTERLPNREEYIQCNGLFIVSDGNRSYAEYFDIYDKKCFGEPVMHGFKADRAVTAWMPLPEPYKEV